MVDEMTDIDDEPIYFKVWIVEQDELVIVDDSLSNTAPTFETVEEDAYREFDTYDDAVGFAEMVAATYGYSVRNETIPF
jgi:hypothetical protein